MERTEGGGLGRSRKELRIGLRSAGQAQVKVKASTEALFAEHIDQGPPFFFFFGCLKFCVLEGERHPS